MSNMKIIILSSVCLALAGCASVAVTEDALTQRTSSSLGLSPDQFTISNRTDSGLRTDYEVRTSSGKSYMCYVTGGISVIGRAVSDAICNEKGAAGQPAPDPSGNCNDLLRAAGKCK